MYIYILVISVSEIFYYLTHLETKLINFISFEKFLNHNIN